MSQRGEYVKHHGEKEKPVSVYFNRIIHETDNAICMECAGPDAREVWVPLSQIDAIHRTNPPVLVMAAWLARKEDLLEQSELIARTM